MSKEAQARIKINKLLEEAGWHFFDNDKGKANISLEDNVKITKKQFDAFGFDFEKTTNGYTDFILEDEKGFPLVVLEAKKESIDPLFAKEQARRYAISLKARYVILSNGNSHYFWDTQRGNPKVITTFPTLESLNHLLTFKPDPKNLSNEVVSNDYIILSQQKDYKDNPNWKDETKRGDWLYNQNLKFLRNYQVEAIKALQESAKKNNERFLFEMATGTGKTLTCAAVIKLFLRTGNAKRILFLVDRLELEDQAYKSFVQLLSKDYSSVIYKQNRDDWKKAEIVISTVQSLTFSDKYKKLFSPTDFDLVISDEAHRSINGNARALFEYFIGYKLGLTATPKDYLKNIDLNQLSINDPRSWEKRQLLDTYKTFGCETTEPTYRYSLLDGVKEGFLINPIVVDARTDITTQLLSDKGYSVVVKNEDGIEEEQTYLPSDFERKFFSDETNYSFCKAFIDNALLDPISGEIGKSVIFCVSQKHASKITQILNELAEKKWPGVYKSDFAIQVTSVIPDAQQFTINFSNNNLSGKTNRLEGYNSSKTRVCVTCGMMTTGYDCQDLLNICLMRPIFSPTDFIQIKGRGTRKYTFKYKEADGDNITAEKERFKLFDYFANVEYFEQKYDYDQVIQLPKPEQGGKGGAGTNPLNDGYDNLSPDPLKTIEETKIGWQGMKVDWKLFESTKSIIRDDSDIADAVVEQKWDKAVAIIRERYENKPEEFVNLDKLRKAAKVDRRITWREVLEVMFGIIPGFKSKDDLLEDEYNKFASIYKPDANYAQPIKNYMKAYITDKNIQTIIDSKEYANLATNPKLTMNDLKQLNGWIDVIPEYVKDYVPLNTYM